MNLNWNTFRDRVKDTLRRTVDRFSTEGVPLSVRNVGRGPAAEPESLMMEGSLEPPAIDVYENDQELVIVADVPGALPKNTSISWDDQGGLTLVARPEPPAGGRTLWDENGTHGWYRALQLPSDVDGDHATSTLKDGVLTIHLPRRTASSSRKIPIQI